jgi:hypothetical protein
MKFVNLFSRATWGTLAALALVLCGSGAAKAQLVYDNGPINGTVEGWTINFGFAVSDSFTLSNPTTLTSAQLGLWLYQGDTASSLDWAIGTSAFGSDEGSGTASLTNVFQYTNGFGYDIYESSFPLSATLNAGTYWLTIQNLSVSNGDPGYWDENNGPSMAQENQVGQINSESFQLYGRTSDVPEPGAYALIGSLGLTGAALLRRKRSR